jgi:hypothetical protein
LRRLFAEGNGNGVDRAQVEFYEAFETLLARQGQTRRAAQTQREFAMDAGRRMAERTGEARVAEWALDLADTFYGVRFGRVVLDGKRVRAVDDTLTKIRQASRRGRPRRAINSGTRGR